jgi:hypothetical protein
MSNFPWAKFLSMLGPILALILGSLSASNAAEISFGAAEASLGNWTLTGGAGLASLVSLVTGLVASWRANGRVSAGEAAETAALGTLSVICLSRGDAIGGRLIDQLGKHLHAQRNPSDTPITSDEPASSAEDLFADLVKRINYDAAAKVTASL